MKIKLLGTVFLHALEEFTATNNLSFKAKFKEKLHPAGVFESYRKMVMDHPQLRLKLVRSGKKFSWQPFTQEETDNLLQFEKEHLMKMHNENDIYSTYYPTNSRLPFRVSLIDETTLVFNSNHVHSPGYMFNTWVEQWLQYYAREINMAVPPLREPGFTDVSIFKKIVYRLLLPFWLIGYILSAGLKAGKKGETGTVDLSHGRKPGPQKLGYAIKTYYFSEAECAGIIKTCRERKLTPLEYIGGVFFRTFFTRYPDKVRICSSLPDDIRRFLFNADPYEPGNLQAALTYYIVKNKPVEKQIRQAQRWVNRGLAYGLIRIMSLLISDADKLIKMAREQAAQRFPDRGPLEDLSCYFYLMDANPSPAMSQMISSISATGLSQIIVFGGLFFNGKFIMEVSFPRGLFDEEEVFSITEAGIMNLKEESKQ